MNLNKLISSMEEHRDELAIAIKVLKKFTAPTRIATAKANVDQALARFGPDHMALLKKKGARGSKKGAVLGYLQTKHPQGTPTKVGDIAAAVGLEGGRVSSILTTLKGEKLVKRSKEGWVARA